MASRRKRRKLNEESCTDKPEIACSPVVVFAHGAGAPSSSDWMIRWKEMLKKRLEAVEVVTFDYPYLADGKRRVAPKAEKLIEFHLDVVKETAAKFPGHPLILAGKSMGSRVSCMVSAVNEDVTAVICLGYPLKGAKGVIRDETLLEMGVPVMFVQGSKDPMCSLDKLEAVCNKMKAVTEIHVIDGGDHSFKIGKKHLETKELTQDEVEDVALKAIAAFVSKSLAQSS
ncbi:Alpha/beta hydrolase fold-1 [Arabidopsis suecica]|uniref:Alpha/beta hydrolase fold-1 n=1 Tax=Arabidopsis suecica TaxID=45249 RepID=A0A8T1YSC5_ARASU|nr:Alpha/beta hydrolase fold-1 [Arabidopsis suecica]